MWMWISILNSLICSFRDFSRSNSHFLPSDILYFWKEMFVSVSLFFSVLWHKSYKIDNTSLRCETFAYIQCCWDFSIHRHLKKFSDFLVAGSVKYPQISTFKPDLWKGVIFLFCKCSKNVDTDIKFSDMKVALSKPLKGRFIASRLVSQSVSHHFSITCVDPSCCKWAMMDYTCHYMLRALSNWPPTC